MWQPCVYMLASRKNGTLYIGVTTDLPQRLWEHQSDAFPKSFTSKYGVKTLVWVEDYDNIHDAIHREKRLKKWKRQWKIDLIEEINPDWQPLHPQFGTVMDHPI